MKSSNPVARLGEGIATDYLKKKGYKIIERNFRRGYGEIDIICVKDKRLIFVEVKTRTSNKLGTPLEQIALYKLHALVRTAQFYKQSHKDLPELLRTDTIGVILDSEMDLLDLKHIENIADQFDN